MTRISYQNFLYIFCMVLIIVGSTLILFHADKNIPPYLCNKQEIIEQNSETSLWLHNQENQIWDHIHSTTHISKQECLRLKEQWSDKYSCYEKDLHEAEKASKRLSTKTRKIVTAIIKDFGLRPQDIPLVSWNVDSYAAATDSALLINEELFAPLPLYVQKFLIGHELQHLIYKDTSTRYILDECYKFSDLLPKNHPIPKLIRFQEIRADIQSALKGDEYLQGYRLFVEMIAQQGENEGLTHPKHSVRLAMANKLIAASSLII